jgi:hypothetical protein
MCDSPQAIVPRFLAVPQSHFRRIAHRLDPRVTEFPPNCRPGDLTIDGMFAHQKVGDSFKKFLPVSLDTGLLYLHAVNDRRPLTAAISFLHGLYPPFNPNEIVPVETGGKTIDYFLPDVNVCGALFELEKEYLATPEFVSIFQETINEVEALLELLGVTNPGVADLEKVCDFALSSACNNVSLVNVTDEMNQKCNEFLGALGLGMFRTNKSVAASAPMREILRLVDLTVNLESSVRLALISGESSTIAALLALLVDGEVENPPYGSHLTFEIWENLGSKELFVRIGYNGKVVVDLESFHDFRTRIAPMLIYCNEYPSDD